MKRSAGCLSPAGLLASLAVVAFVAIYTALNGGALFSPGPVTATSSRNLPLGGYYTHAEFEKRCNLCHRPWHGVDPLRCVACHTGVRDQVAARSGLHGRLQNPDACTLCHTDHQGRDADITTTALTDFPHQQVGFSLVHHRQRANDQLFTCADCHPTPDYRFDQTLCKNCHADIDAAFMAQHLADFGPDCLACHDGSGAMTAFDHNALFVLDGAHANLECIDCHVNHQFKDIGSDCLTCHAEPEVHRGQFGADCIACHTTTAWSPALLLEHAFPLDHGSRTESECQVCHPANYVTYTCYGCHEHDPARVQREHQEEGIRDFENCIECHPTGREGEAKDDD